MNRWLNISERNVSSPSRKSRTLFIRLSHQGSEQSELDPANRDGRHRIGSRNSQCLTRVLPPAKRITTFRDACKSAVISIIFLVFFSSVGHADSLDSLFISPSIYYFTENIQLNAENNDGEIKRSFLNLNVNVGFGLGNGLVLGVKAYNQTEDNVSRLFDYSNKLENQTLSIGSMVGYSFEGFMICFAPMVIQTPEKTNGVRKYFGGNGYIIDGQYLIEMGGWSLGPQISIVNFTYSKYSVAGDEQDNFVSLTEKNLFPYVSFLVRI